jgi:hypothetical protein
MCTCLPPRALTHELRCECAALILPPDAVITGRSAAVLRGVPLALPADPIVFITREYLREPHRMVCTVRAALQARAAA